MSYQVRLRRLAAAMVVAAAVGAVPFVHAAARPPKLDYTMTTLPNGLNVVFLEDHSTPIVHLQIWYHVGSKNEKAGRTGFAHLFEHMMFKSTAHMKSETMDRLTEDVGGYNNASTANDATWYYEEVPSNYLQTLLWAEADRMGSLNVDEANFKSEREVVKEEFRTSVLAPPYGLFAYSTGCCSSGISDPVLRQKASLYLCNSRDRTAVITAFLRATYYKSPYTIEDVVKFINWLESDLHVYMGFL